jgi:hypothetical protein
MDVAAGKFRREVVEVVEFYVDKNNEPQYNYIYRKTAEGQIIRNNPTQNLIDYLATSGIIIPSDIFVKKEQVETLM